MVSRTSVTTSLLSLRHRCYSAYSPRHGEYQTAEGIGRRGMRLRSRFLVSSSSMLTLGDCTLTIDNVTCSSMVAAILCLTLCKIALPLRRAFATAYITNCHLAFVPHHQHSSPCKLRLSFLSPTSLTSVRRTSTRTRLTVLSELNTDVLFIPLCHLAHEGSRGAVRWRQSPELQWMPAVIPRARTWYTPICPRFEVNVKTP